MQTISLSEARALALSAQGFMSSRPATPDASDILRAISHVQLLQIDAVNVLVRAQYLPLFARLGPYSRDLLDSLVYEQRHLFEYEGHAACLLPAELEPSLRWRMRMFELNPNWRSIVANTAGAVLAEIEARGALNGSGLSQRGKRLGTFWTQTEERVALDWLHLSGKISVSNRAAGRPVYDLKERVLPAAVLTQPEKPLDEARCELLLRAASALGVATADDLVEYFQLARWRERLAVLTGGSRARRAVDLVQDLVVDGRLEEVRVESWDAPAYMPPGLASATVSTRALVSPFDSLLFHRARVSRLFQFTHSFEIYIPQAQRRYGYYVLSFLLGDSLVARVDLKAERKSGELQVRGAFGEEGIDAAHVAEELAQELRVMAAWLGLGSIAVAQNGDLAGPLSACVAALPAA
jgi:uncharacterized protein YcaQ